MSDESSDVGSDAAITQVKPSPPKPRRKIPVIIPQARSPSEMKRKIRYMHQVGLNLNPLGFKPPEADNENS